MCSASRWNKTGPRRVTYTFYFDWNDNKAYYCLLFAQISSHNSVLHATKSFIHSFIHCHGHMVLVFCVICMWEEKNFFCWENWILVNRQQSTIKSKTNEIITRKKINFGDIRWANVCHLKCNFKNYRRDTSFLFGT